MLTSVDSLNFDNLSRIIRQRTGLLLNENRYADLLRALSETTPLSNGDLLTNLSVYDYTHPLWQKVIETVTIGETYFFRNQRHFEVLRNHLLPGLIAARRQSGHKYLRIWSTGCSTGEEPYSIAMLLHDLLPDIKEWMITILATDLNMMHLEMARLGEYRARSFRSETPATIRARWFEDRDGTYVIDPEIRRMVSFKSLNLIEGDYPGYVSNTMNMDMVICRNVTIYFERADTIRVMKQLHQSIVSNGWLIVGHSEPQHEVYDAFKTVILDGATFYQKPEVVQQSNAAATTPLKHTHTSAPSPAILKPKPDLNRNGNGKTASRPNAPRPPTPPTATPPAPQASEIPLSDYEQLFLEAKAAADHENWEKSLALLSRIDSIDVMKAPVHYLRALISLHNGEQDAAKELLRRAIYCDPKFALAHYTLGDVYRQMRKKTEALRHWRLTLQSLEGLEDGAIVPHDNDLTVEALVDLVAYQMKTLTE